MGAAQPALSSLINTSKTSIYNQQLADKITLLAGHINAANYRFLKLIAEFDKREAWADEGIRSCAHWLNWKCGIALSAAREKVRVAQCLSDLPKTNEAFSEGIISYSKVRAISRVATNNNEDFLLNIAKQGTASHMEILVRKFQQVKRQVKRTEVIKQADQDRKKKSHEQIQHDSREMISYQDDNGMLIIHAKLPAEAGAIVVKAIDAILREHSVLENNEKEENVSAETSFEDKTEDIPTIKPVHLSFAKRRADALTTMAEHFIASNTNNEGIKTLAGHERCQIMLHVDIKTLQNHANCTTQHENHANHHCNLDNRQWLSPETAKRLSCDASLVTVLEDDKGKVLNIGRRSRTIPPAIVKALNLRDTSCQYPSCCTSKHLDAHHIIHWANGGETRLNNLVMLCRHHHTKLHQGAFTIETKATGTKSLDIVYRNTKGKQLRQSIDPQFRKINTSHQSSSNYLEKHFPQINPNTAITSWKGEKLDYDMAMGGLI